MASTTSFKQQCPSCEAMVPIRDPALVGRKIDCPKCKYRFVVEKPGKKQDDEDDDSDTPAPTKKVKKTNGAIKAGKPAAAGVKGKAPPRRRDDDDEDEEDERPKKKKSGMSMTVILGAVLGLVALGLLGVGGFMLLGGSGGSSKDNKGASNTPSAPSGPAAPTNNDKPPDKKDAPAAGPTVADISNLLPNDSEAVFNLQIDRLSSSGFRQAAFGTPGAFNEAGFKNTFGFPLYDAGAKDGVSRIVMALNNSSHWVFTVLRTLKPVNKDQLIANLDLAPQEKPVNGLTVYSVRRDMDSLSNLLVKANRPHEDLQLCILDGQTLVFADPAPMKAFADAKGRPTPLSQATAAAPPPANPNGPPGFGPPGGSSGPSGPPGGSSGPGSFSPPGGSSGPSGPPGGSSGPGGPPGGSSGPSGPPGGSSGPSGPPGGSSGPGGFTPPGGSSGPGGPAPAAPAAPPPPAALGSYLTIDPGMKALFDRIELPDQPVLFSAVLSAKDPLLQPQQEKVDAEGIMQLAKILKQDEAMLRDAVAKQKIVKLQDIGVNRIGVSMTAFSPDKAGGTVAVQYNNETLAKTYYTLGQTAVAALNTALGGGNPGAAGPGGNGPPGFGPPGGSSGPGPLTPGVNGPPGFSPPGGSSGPGSGGPMPPPGFGPPGGSSGSGGPTPPPGFGPPGGSSGSGGPTPPPGFGPPGGSSGPGSGPPGFGPPGFGPPATSQGPASLTQDKDILVFSATISAPTMDDVKFQAAEQQLGVLMVRIKGVSDMLSTRSHVHELAAALQKYLKDKGHLPRGTADRARTAERFIEWEPNQRVSWMAELLPYLADGEYAGLAVDKDKSWLDEPNLHVAGVLIPQYLGRVETQASPLVWYPGAPDLVAVTNFVGVAGVGLDAAEYGPGNPKNGAFGYDRETKADEFKDGLDKTILLLQAPTEFKAPWLAGGGATVRGVSEGPDAIRPFVCAEYQGKRGTFAVMGDGKVRFIPETIDPNVFRALCTIAGGEKIDRLDEIAPEVPGDQQGPKAEAPGPVAAPPAPASPPAAAADDATKKDMQAIQGTWKITAALDVGGKQLAPNELPKVVLTFAGDKMSKTMDGKADGDGTFRLDASKSPPTIDSLHADGTTHLGIYQIQGDQMQIAFGAKPGSQRPKDFGDKEAFVSLFQRDKQ